MRQGDEPADGGEIGTAHLHVGDHGRSDPSGVLEAAVAVGISEMPSMARLTAPSAAAALGKPRPSQQQDGKRGGGKHDEVLQPEDVRELEDPGDPVEQPQQGCETDNQDRSGDDAAQDAYRCGPRKRRSGVARVRRVSSVRRRAETGKLGVR